MRYYALKIGDPATNKPILEYSSYPGGVSGGGQAAGFGIPSVGTPAYDPGALNIIFDTLVYPADAPMGGSTITLEGVDPAILTNAQQFAGQLLTLSAGMGPGLPLAKPSQAGIIMQAKILQAFGNWVGTQVSMAFVIYPAFFTPDNPGNIVLNWKAGTPLAVALRNTLQVAYPHTQIHINIADTTLAHDEVHACGTLTTLGRLLQNITPNNVQIWHIGQAIIVSDSSQNPTPKPLNFEDMIGQPQWIQPAVIQVSFAMRADLQPGDVISFPQATTALPGFVTTAQSAIPSARNYQSAIMGQFTVQSIRQIGNLRQPTGSSWCTVVNAAVKPPIP